MTSSAEFLNAVRAVEYYREEIRRNPEAVKNYVELAQLFLQEARVTGNHHEYIENAQHLLEEALSREPHNAEAMITKASLLMTLHRFQQANDLAEKVTAMYPYHAFSYGVLCDALVELGEYDEAVRACDRMLEIRPDLRSYSRASYLRELHGDVQGARAAMTMAANAGVWGQENRAWALYNLGNLYLHDGQVDTAEFIYNGILEERPGYSYALSGLAHVHLARGENQEAIQLLNKPWVSTRDHVFLEQLADAYKAAGDEAKASEMAALVLEAYEHHREDGWNTEREYAMFCANHEINLPEALERAKREYDRRPNNIDVEDTYAWVLYKNGRAEEAMDHIERAMRLNTRIPNITYHAGMIYYALGKYEQAREKLQQAVRSGWATSMLYISTARKTLQSISGLGEAI